MKGWRISAEFYRKVFLDIVHVPHRKPQTFVAYVIRWTPSVRVNSAKRGENQKGNALKVFVSKSNSAQVRHK